MDFHLVLFTDLSASGSLLVTREGYFADVVLFDLYSNTEVNEHNILSKCKWSPFENTSFNSKVVHTIVSGNHIYKDGQINGEPSGLRMEFNRD